MKNARERATACEKHLALSNATICVDDDFGECVSKLKHSLDELEKQAMSHFKE